MENKSENSGMKKFSRENVPVVFMFQPTQYKIVSPDEHKQWEKDLIEKVGLKGVKYSEGLETWSMCYGANDWDDCDAL
jgi:hypothetical protein